MNENDSPGTPKPNTATPAKSPLAIQPGKPLPFWLARLVAYNPFYIISAALLLYGIYRVSVEPMFIGREVAQLCFNLSSLQTYEALLVGTAIILARRAITYDSRLLVSLENMLVLVPFILISQAALIDSRIVWSLSLAGGVLAIARFGSLNRWIKTLHLPGRLLGLGLVVLVMNVGLPVAYRLLHESKFGTKPDWGLAYETNQYIWWLGLPLLCSLLALVPIPRRETHLASQHRFLPHGFFLLWLCGTIVHLYCLGYIYDFNLRPDFIAPAAWVLLWMFCRRATDLLPALKPEWQRALWIPPLFASLLAIPQTSKGVFLALTLLDVIVYATICYRQRWNKLALHLLVVSLLALISALPQGWVQPVVGDLSRFKCVGAAAALYVLVWMVLSRNPKIGLLGGLIVASTVAFILGERSSMPHWAAQAGLAFLLLHSLRWQDAEQQGAVAVRCVTALLWIGHAIIWMQTGAAFWMVLCVAGPVLVGSIAVRFFSGQWGPKVVPLAAIIVLLASPGDLAASKALSAPMGLVAIVGSFLLFGIGTFTALTKHLWHRD